MAHRFQLFRAGAGSLRNGVALESDVRHTELVGATWRLYSGIESRASHEQRRCRQRFPTVPSGRDSILDEGSETALRYSSVVEMLCGFNHAVLS
jgi:hypothetical protein